MEYKQLRPEDRRFLGRLVQSVLRTECRTTNAEDRKDAAQELQLHLITVLRNFDPSRASLRTFAARAARSRARDLRRHAHAQSRDPIKELGSIDAHEESHREGLEHQRIPQFDSHMQESAHESEDHSDLRMDVVQFFESVPPSLVDLCRQRQEGMTVEEVAEASGISVATAYRRFRQVRTLMDKAGLKDYVA